MKTIKAAAILAIASKLALPAAAQDWPSGRAMLLGSGDPMMFFSRPISAVVLLLTLGLLLLGLRSAVLSRRLQWRPA